MKALLGIWHSEAVLFFRTRPLFPGLVVLDRNDGEAGTVRFLSQAGGREATLHKADAEETMDYPFIIRTDRMENDEFCRCGLMPIDLRPIAGTSHDWMAELPPDYLFPWPLGRDCEQYVRSEELATDLERRRRFARAAGVRFPTPPGHITRAMTAKQRKALFSSAAA